MKITRHIAFLALTTVNVALAQPSNDVCPNAVQLCPGVTVSGTTTSATSAADDYGFCYTPENTVWFRFITNSSGEASQLIFRIYPLIQIQTMVRNYEHYSLKHPAIVA